MALTPQQLDGIGQLLVSLAPDINPLPALRASLPGLAVSRCDASDMRGETAFRLAGAYQVFLVDTASHCWRMVDNPDHASGVVIAPCAF
jgi:hypothetical protein